MRLRSHYGSRLNPSVAAVVIATAAGCSPRR